MLAGSAAVVKGAPKYPVADLSMMRRSIAIDELSMYPCLGLHFRCFEAVPHVASAARAFLGALACLCSHWYVHMRFAGFMSPVAFQDSHGAGRLSVEYARGRPGYADSALRVHREEHK